MSQPSSHREPLLLPIATLLAGTITVGVGFAILITAETFAPNILMGWRYTLAIALCFTPAAVLLDVLGECPRVCATLVWWLSILGFLAIPSGIAMLMQQGVIPAMNGRAQGILESAVLGVSIVVAVMISRRFQAFLVRARG